jgi:hypothetical protein
MWFGSTITIPASQGAFLIAFLAVFVRWTSSHLWSIICFAIHQYRSSTKDRDGLYHQQQALLRNTPSDSLSIWIFIKLYRRWKSRSRGALGKSVALVLVAGLHFSVFAIAGIFSSKVAVTGDEVLVKSGQCGWMAEYLGGDMPSQQSLRDIRSALYVSGRWSAEQSLAYASACYGRESAAYSSLCSIFAVKRIESQINRTSLCPFARSTCEKPYAAEIDTGYLDSSFHLGINTPEGERVKFRRVTTCATIPAEDKFASNWSIVIPPGYPPNDSIYGNDSFRYYYLGKTPLSNWSFVVSKRAMWFQEELYVVS